MAGRNHLSTNVLEEAIERIRVLYRQGDRVTVSFSAGKDSGVCLELAILAATLEDRLPVDVVMRDEEIMLPGTFEYAERVAARPEVNFHWLYANQPITNAYNRTEPYFWVFDPDVAPDRWVRKPPPFAAKNPDLGIWSISSLERFPPDPGKRLVNIIGMRVLESGRRLLGLHSSGGYMTRGTQSHGSWVARPIYDWSDGDVWLAHKRFGWDYNRAYDTMHRLGVPKHLLRIAPPTLSPVGLFILQQAAKAWPDWFERLCDRLPGVRQAVLFGTRWVTPERRLGETWQQTFWRECVEKAPAPWLAERSEFVARHWIERHARHASTPFPDEHACVDCKVRDASWKRLAEGMYFGDPLGLGPAKQVLPDIEPEFFKPHLPAAEARWRGKGTF